MVFTKPMTWANTKSLEKDIANIIAFNDFLLSKSRIL